jgi:3-methyl-2-oxobutanoate hydroxymethyltransferase
VHDLLGLTTGYVPKHVRQYAKMSEVITDAVERFCVDVRSGEFPNDEQSFQ